MASNDACLELLMRELSDVGEIHESVVAVIGRLRRGRLLRPPTSMAMLSRWCSHTASLLGGTSVVGKIAGAVLVKETVPQCEELIFSRHREAWCTSLLSALQPAAQQTAPASTADGSKGEGSKDEDSAGQLQLALQQAAALALAQVVSTAVGWPAQRREVTGCASRLVATLLPIIASPAGAHAGQLTALQALLQLARHNPPSLRQQRPALASAAVQLAMTAKPCVAQPAASLVGALPACAGGASFAEAWLASVQRLAVRAARLKPTARGLAAVPALRPVGLVSPPPCADRLMRPPTFVRARCRS